MAAMSTAPVRMSGSIGPNSRAQAHRQAATASGKPVLLRIDFDAGHGIGSTRKQRNDELADTLAFLLWQFGVKGYVP